MQNYGFFVTSATKSPAKSRKWPNGLAESAQGAKKIPSIGLEDYEKFRNFAVNNKCNCNSYYHETN
jgi:hypothetical protein